MRSLKITLFFLLLPLGNALHAAPTATTHPSGDAIVQFLDQTIDWYRRMQSVEQSTGQSRELLLRSTLMQNARQVVQLTLRFARAEVSIMELESKAATTSPANSPAARVAKAAAEATERAAAVQAQLDALDKQIQSEPGGSVDRLYARRYELTAELNLANTQRDVLQEYAMFMVSTESGDSTAIAQKIDELERSVPEVQSGSNKSLAPAASTPSAPAAPAFQPETVGIFGLVREIMRLSNRIGEIDRLANDASDLRLKADRFREPIRDDVINTMRLSTAAASSTQPEAQDPATMEARGMQIDQLTDRFKQLSSASIPLAEQSFVIDAVRDGLMEWRAALSRQYSSNFRELLLRLGTLIGTILVIFVVSEIWRRGTFRYIKDTRRQRQLMVVRRIVIGALVMIVISASVVSEFGSLATFAGLITAGVAVALQTVILSGVAYFFFIGRFGVRVGDRVSITGITGDVIEIGLFRIYLMELGGTTPDLRPTGRIVTFSNSVLFQPSAFYKQMPGSDYIWHEVAVTVAPDSDYKLVEERLLGAVNAVFGDYREAVEQQHERISRSLHINMGRPIPEGRLRFTDAGLEYVVRYPVDIHRAAEIDDRITRELLKAINEQPKLETVSGTPKIRPA